MKSIKEKGAVPSAWIVNPKDKGRKSIKKGNIYLKNGDEFEIEIFNPLKISVLSDIKINGESISKSGLVIKPGQRVYLDCFIDDGRKFKFETYLVEDTDESNESISNNGLLEVFFYKEDVIQFDNWRNLFNKRVIREYYPIYVERYPYWYYDHYRPNIIYGSGINTGTGNYVNNATTGDHINQTNYTSNSQYSSNLLEIASIPNKNTIDKLFPYSKHTSNIETGRVEKGEKSNQKFDEVNMNFEKNYISSVIYRLFSDSKEPKEIKKTKKVDFNIPELILKLSELKDAGILTESEFSEKKKELLDRI
jgi:hypothetical protein